MLGAGAFGGLIAALLAAAPAGPRLEVESAEPLPELTGRFVRTEGWTGGDCAASVPLGGGRTL